MRIFLLLVPCLICSLSFADESLPDSLRAPMALIDEGEDTVENLNRALADLKAATREPLTPRQACSAHTYQALAYLRLGDLAQAPEAKLQHFERGRRAAEEAAKADPSCPDAYFYRGALKAKWGEVRGVVNSLFLLGEIRGDLRKVLELDPSHQDAKLALGQVDHAVPGILGGSNQRAETAYREVVRADPGYTGAMLHLAELLADTGRKDEAIGWVRKVIEHPSPTRPWEWRKFDRARAQRLLARWTR